MKRFYIASDYELMVDTLKAEINFLKSSWQNLLGRPLVVLTLNQMHLGTVMFYLYRYIRNMLAGLCRSSSLTLLNIGFCFVRVIEVCGTNY